MCFNVCVCYDASACSLFTVRCDSEHVRVVNIMTIVVVVSDFNVFFSLHFKYAAAISTACCCSYLCTAKCGYTTSTAHIEKDIYI